MKMLPPSRPGWPREKVASRLFDGGVRVAVAMLGVRGYYLDTMGVPGVNDRGIYDDAIFINSPSGCMAFNANVDPSIFRHGVANLAPGLHFYKKGNHGLSRPGGGYPAFRPATPDESLPVIRDGKAGLSPGIAINIHRGSRNSTSSLGCQTIHPDQWEAFRSLGYSEMDRHGQKTIPYLLILA
jgi:lysozyme